MSPSDSETSSSSSSLSLSLSLKLSSSLSEISWGSDSLLLVLSSLFILGSFFIMSVDEFTLLVFPVLASIFPTSSILSPLGLIVKLGNAVLE